MSWIKCVVILNCCIFSIKSHSNCELHDINDDEISCHSSNFTHYNISTINSSYLISPRKLRLTNGYYYGSLNRNIYSLIIVEYPFESLILPFYSPSTLSNLIVEHTYLNKFPTWLCKYNRNLSSIEIDYSHIEQIIEHDLHLCSNLQTLHITHSFLKQFTSREHVLLSISNLYLTHNQISNLSYLNLDEFPRLRTLDLSYNTIKSISSDNFNRTVLLTKFDLSYNQIEKFHLTSQKFLTSIKILNLRANNELQINKNWSNYFPYLTKISFPYAYFCCNYDSDFKIYKTKQSSAFSLEQSSSSISFHSERTCFPSPDSMTACESLFPTKFSRFTFLLIVCISVISNLAALIMTIYRLITTSYNRWLSATLFSSNLALADFISTIYLILVGIIDIQFRETFYIKTHLWTKSNLCTFAGFIYIFGIQSSIYALTLLTFERFYTILFSFKRQTPWPPKFTFTVILLGWLVSLLVASLPLINVNDFHSNSLCVPFRIETLFDRFYLSLLILFDLAFIGIITTCNGLICFNFSKSHVHTINDARTTLKILMLNIAICVSRIPLVIFIFLALIVHPTDSNEITNYGLHFTNIKLAVLFLQPFSSCFNPFMYSSLLTNLTRTTTNFERPKPIRQSKQVSRFRSKSVGFHRDYHPLRMMSITSLDFRFSSQPDTPEMNVS